MSVEILRFTPYLGGRGNAVAFADVVVREGGRIYTYSDVKLYQDGAGLKISPKQVRTESGWEYAYLIPTVFQKAIRKALIERYHTERIGQYVLL